MDCEISFEYMIANINKKRKEMMRLAKTYGFTDEHTLKCSQELDELINEYHRMKYEKKYKNFFVFEARPSIDKKDLLLYS